MEPKRKPAARLPSGERPHAAAPGRLGPSTLRTRIGHAPPRGRRQRAYRSETKNESNGDPALAHFRTRGSAVTLRDPDPRPSGPPRGVSPGGTPPPGSSPVMFPSSGSGFEDDAGSSAFPCPTGAAAEDASPGASVPPPECWDLINFSLPRSLAMDYWYAR
jgi:hypothetical protein